MQSITVVGGGSWATALVKILSNNADTIHWWLRNPETVAFINQYQHNPNYLSDVEIDLEKVVPSANLEECIRQSEMILLAIPAAFLKTALMQVFIPAIFKDKIVFSAIKGIVPEHNMIVGDYMHKVD
jgi:glycerol-3-phosphate dehydrogenase (NAD(P)+)